MKKIFLLMAVALLGCFAFAQADKNFDAVKALNANPTTTTQKSDTAWDFFQIGFWFGVPTDTQDVDVYGLKVGAPFCSGKNVTGVETSVFASADTNVDGVASSILVTSNKNVTGFQGAIVNYADNVKGLQFGIVNISQNASFQLGILNYNKNGILPYLPIVNWNF